MSRIFDSLVINEMILSPTSKRIFESILENDVTEKYFLNDFTITRENNEVMIEAKNVKSRCYKENGKWFETDEKEAEEIFNTDIIQKLDRFIREEKLSKLLS